MTIVIRIEDIIVIFVVFRNYVYWGDFSRFFELCVWFSDSWVCFFSDFVVGLDVRTITGLKVIIFVRVYLLVVCFFLEKEKVVFSWIYGLRIFCRIIGVLLFYRSAWFRVGFLWLIRVRGVFFGRSYSDWYVEKRCFGINGFWSF